MNRGIVTAAVAVTGLLMGGCSSETAGTPVSPVAADASGVDMCTILPDAELSQLGIRVDTRQPMDRLGEVGCGWVGKPFTLDLERSRDTVADYVARRHDPQFVTFAENTVNGRAGAKFSVSLSGEDCVQLMDGGPVALSVGVAAASSLGPPIDPCAEALRIAELIEPRLPEAGT